MTVKLTDLQLIYGVAGAREKFEDLCTHLIRSEHPQLERVRIVRGDGGIDAHEGEMGSTDAIDVYQIKFFPAGIGDSQKNQLRESFKSILQTTKITVNNWTLCLPVDLSIEEKTWFAGWVGNQSDSGITICPPWTALELERLLYEEKNKGIKEAFFKEQHLAQIRDMSQTLTKLAAKFESRVPDPALAVEKKREWSDKLAAFVTDGQQLFARVKEGASPIQDINAWIECTGAYLKDNLGISFEVRLNNFSGMVFYGDGSEKSQMEKAIDGRLRRLHEFLQELNRH